jgi:hypothetical protein
MGGLGLNLAGADISGQGFEAVESGPYHCKVRKVEVKHTTGDSGSLPKGTPYLNVQFQVVEGENHEKRVFFGKYFMAPAKIDGKPYEHKQMMDAMLGGFFKALGYDEEEITAKGFDPDADELEGKELTVIVGQQQKYNAEPGVMDNIVKGVRPLGAGSAAVSSLL